MHRLYHIPFLYRHFHKLHHTYKQPTAFSVTALHPFETVSMQMIMALPIVLIPVHWCKRKRETYNPYNQKYIFFCSNPNFIEYFQFHFILYYCTPTIMALLIILESHSRLCGGSHGNQMQYFMITITSIRM